jgi:spermidine/putrescine transport system substrate-binding protein
MRDSFHQTIELLRNLEIFIWWNKYMHIFNNEKRIGIRLQPGVIIGLAFLITACASVALPLSYNPTALPQEKEIVFCDYPDDLPQTVLDEFTAETGIQVNYQAYAGLEEAIQMVKGRENCDVIAIGNDYILELSRDGYLAKLNKTNLPNLKNISANFRDMIYDPQNFYTVPYIWGTTGLLFRSDLVQMTHWSDLWNLKIQGQIGLWRSEPRDVIGIALKSLGFSVNSEKPSEVNAAVDRLIELGSRVVFLDDEKQDFAAQYLKEGKVVMAMGWAPDAIQGRKANPAIRYIIPEEGSLVWGFNFVIPSTTSSQRDAEMFLDFILRPQISANITNYNSYATSNQAAFAYINPETLNDPVIFPPNEALKKTEICLALSPEGEKLYAKSWMRFLDSFKAP